MIDASQKSGIQFGSNIFWVLDGIAEIGDSCNQYHKYCCCSYKCDYHCFLLIQRIYRCHRHCRALNGLYDHILDSVIRYCVIILHDRLQDPVRLYSCACFYRQSD